MKTLLNNKTFIIAMALVIGITFAGFAEDALYIDANGNVGIGTTSPMQTFHLFNNDNYQLRMSHSGVGTWDIDVYTGDKFAIREDGESPSLVIQNNKAYGTK